MSQMDLKFRAIMKFIESGHDERDDITPLIRYLQSRGVSVEVDDLRKDIEMIRLKREQKLQLERIEAILFTKDGKMKPMWMRYGSAFCPSCGLFKNYEKECPYCGYHEMTD